MIPRSDPSGKPDRGNVRPRLGNPPQPGRLFGDDRPDAVEEFAALVACRQAGDIRRAKAHTATLRTLGWSICGIQPRVIGGRQ